MPMVSARDLHPDPRNSKIKPPGMGVVSPPDTTFAERWRERRWNFSPALPPQFLSCSGGWQLIASRFVLPAQS